MTCVLKRRFGPQVTSTNPHIDPPSIIVPVYAPNTQVAWTWPYGMSTTELIMRAPDMGEDHDLHLKRVNNTSRGGTIHYYRDSEWPKTEILSLGFSGLCDSDVDDVLEFLDVSLGGEVGFLDWLGRQWRGVILDPAGNLVESGTSDDNKMSIVFRGQLV